MVGMIAFVFAFKVFFNFFIIVKIVLLEKIKKVKNKENPQILKDFGILIIL